MENNTGKVLYIDDEEVNLVLFEESFSRLYQVFTAYSTKDAEELMHKHEFSVIISDINLPNESGLDFFKRLENKEIEPIFIILTAFVTQNFLLEALNQGRIYRYLTKPWNFNEVKFAIDRAIQLYNLRYHNRELFKETVESQQNFFNIFQSSQSGILILDTDEYILEANAAFLQNFNNYSKPVIGAQLTDYIPSDLVPPIRNLISSTFEQNAARNTYEYSLKADTQKILEILCTKIEIKSKSAVMLTFRDITERRQNEQKILAAIIQAEEKERSRLAKDLHDGLGPIMATLKMYLEWISDQEKLKDNPDVLALSLNTINEAIVTLKNISNNLSPHILEKFGLHSAIITYIDKIKKVSPIKFTVKIDLEERFSLAAEMSIYRVITECINNTVSYAGATHVFLSLWKSTDSIHMVYTDNGKGFSEEEIRKSNNGMGLHNMNNRIKTMGGKFRLRSEPGSGITIESDIPLNNIL